MPRLDGDSGRPAGRAPQAGAWLLRFLQTLAHVPRKGPRGDLASAHVRPGFCTLRPWLCTCAGVSPGRLRSRG